MKRITDTLLDRLCAEARASPRRRVNFNLHEGHGDSIQRFLNVMQPGTYVRPHRHTDPGKWELTVVLRGRLRVLLCDDRGKVLECVDLANGGSLYGIELPPGAWHTSAVLEADTVLLEIKVGPYDVLSDKEFASWAPPENHPECARCERMIREAAPGDSIALDHTGTPPLRDQ